MAQFDNIPYVFELARIHMGCVSDKEFSMTYEDYSVYSKIFDDMPESGKMRIIECAKKRKSCV
jgi:hypothetical protein